MAELAKIQNPCVAKVSRLLHECFRARWTSPSTALFAVNTMEAADEERLSQKATILARVGWELVSHLIIGGHKARRYAELANGDFIWCHVQCSWSQLWGQPQDVRQLQVFLPESNLV